MGNIEDKMDITKNIKLIEMLKSQLLTCVADLYSNMTQNSTDSDDRYEILADLIILSFVLGNRLGVGAEALEHKIVKKLKLSALEDKESLHSDVVELLRYFNGK